MKIALAQLDPIVGAFEENTQKIKQAYERACAEQAHLLLTPELGLCGYPPLDLALRPEMFERNEKALAELAEATRGRECALVVGHIASSPYENGRAAQNVVSVLENGKQVFRQAKSLLPTYDVFDEARYFEPAREIGCWERKGKRIAIAICEDLWALDPALGRSIYRENPVDSYARHRPDLLISISASPYVYGKRMRRESLHGDIARRLKAPLVYVNQVGATDEILFDGASFALGADGKILGRLPAFHPSFGILKLDAPAQWLAPSPEEREDEPPEEIEVLFRGLVTGIREYFLRTGFRKAVLGLSGGIDSAVTAALAVRALGAENVLGVAMPSQYSSSHSLTDAEELARNLGIRLEMQPIKFLYSTASRQLAEGRGGTLAPLAQESLQSRLRGLALMALSNHDGSLVLTTGNKSELSTGYCTLYGDMCGALAPLGDVLKTRVYELARHINRTGGWRTEGGVIPESSITKAPSAELKPGQTDQDTLPPYDALDELLTEYVEMNVSVDELTRRHGPWASDVLRRLEHNEFKRRQAAPVLKISAKAFGVGRRVPIAKKWE